MRFRDRVEAGQLLATALEPYRGTGTVVYALPRGGVVLGAGIARHLRAALEIIVVRKVGHPDQPEYAVAAVAEDGCRIAHGPDLASLPPAWIDQAIARERAEARRRRLLYAGDHLPSKRDGRTAILVDDGLATGLTMECAIGEVRHHRPATLVVAAPVAPEDTVRRLSHQVDAVVVLEVPRRFIGAVGAYYDDFSQLGDDDVIALLREAWAADGGA
jgi:putative phosphoribosyl transferase